MSVYIESGTHIINYAGVVTTTVRHNGVSLRVTGLSHVATDPDFRRLGLASRVIRSTTDYIAASGGDLGLCTCAKELSGLYSRVGGWRIAPEFELRGGPQPDVLTSSELGVVVLIRLFSARARSVFSDLNHATIDSGLPLGQFQ